MTKQRTCCNKKINYILSHYDFCIFSIYGKDRKKMIDTKGNSYFKKYLLNNGIDIDCPSLEITKNDGNGKTITYYLQISIEK